MYTKSDWDKLYEDLRNGDAIVDVWSITDVHDQYTWMAERDDRFGGELTDGDARDILERMKNDYDANSGLTWDGLTEAVEDWFDQPEGDPHSIS